MREKKGPKFQTNSRDQQVEKHKQFIQGKRPIEKTNLMWGLPWRRK